MKLVRWMIRFIKCSMMFYFASIVFLLATHWIFPVDANGEIQVSAGYALLDLVVGFLASVRYWREQKRWELEGKPPFDWKLLLKSAGMFFGLTMVFMIALESVYPGYSEGIASVPYWCKGAAVGCPTILTAAWVFGRKRKQKRLTGQTETPKPLPEETEKAAPQRTVTADPKAMYLHRLRRSDDAIEDPAVSERIRRMIENLGRIFAWVEDHPAAEGELKQLMDYYLPMTMKLLDTYAEMDALEVEGENIRTSKREIEGTLEELNRAYEKLLDDLVADTALDISTDIAVLRTMLANQGLTEDELTRLCREME